MLNEERGRRLDQEYLMYAACRVALAWAAHLKVESVGLCSWLALLTREDTHWWPAGVAHMPRPLRFEMRWCPSGLTTSRDPSAHTPGPGKDGSEESVRLRM